MKSKKTAFVTGATGTIGPTLIRHLLGDGYRVRVLLRAEPQPGLLPDELEVIRGDVTQPESYADALAQVDDVFHLAARLHVNDPGPELTDVYQRVNVEGTESLAQMARAAGVARFVYFSTINVYGTGMSGTVYTETSPAAPETTYARTKQQAEQIVLQQHPGSTVLRLAAVYGPRMRGNYPLLLRALRKGVSVMVGDGQNRRTIVYVDDVAQAAVQVARDPAAIGEIYNVTDGQIHTFDAIARAIQRALGKPERMWYMPSGVVRNGLSLTEKAAKLAGINSPVGPALIDKLTEDMAVSGARLQRELGFTPAFSLDRGWAAAVRQDKV